MSKVQHLAEAIRLKNWWFDKIAFAVSIALSLALVTRSDFEATATILLFGLIAIASLGAYGYGINDIGDADADRRSGRQRRPVLAHLPRGRAATFCLVTVVIGIAGAWPLGPEVVAVEIFGFLLASAYSLAPFRLKERGALGILAGSCAQRTVPTAIYVIAWGNHFDPVPPVPFAALLLIWSTLVGVRWMLAHQLLDAVNDRRAGVRTWVTLRGEDFLRWVSERFVFPAEAAGFAAVAAVLVAASVWVTVGLVAALPAWFRLTRERRDRGPVARWLPLSLAYRVWWPLSVLLALTIADLRYSAVLLVYLLVFRPFRGTKRKPVGSSTTSTDDVDAGSIPSVALPAADRERAGIER